MKNTEKARNPNADLTFEKKKTYGCRFTAESRRRSLDQLRLIQRPRLRKTRGALAAAELGFWGVERRKTMEREE